MSNINENINRSIKFYQDDLLNRLDSQYGEIKERTQNSRDALKNIVIQINLKRH